MEWDSVATPLGTVAGWDDTAEVYLPVTGFIALDPFELAQVMLEIKPNNASPTVIVILSVYPTVDDGANFADEPARRFEMLLTDYPNLFAKVPLPTVSGVSGFRIGFLGAASTHTHDAKGSYKKGS